MTTGIKSVVEEMGGVHFAMMKNPLHRINSQFTGKLIQQPNYIFRDVSFEKENFYDYVQNYMDSSKQAEQYIVNLIKHLLCRMLNGDLDNISNYPQQN